ncbi:MAG: exonuclease domain-containing protein [Alphaproteobacteria bacterium]|nr:exonuclease domain-containing protein [Alphaproteobacteria bacterium]MDD9920442.1 exonuclease domain-containing protein [Alphaproteobacteria bacterium]
MPDSIIIYDTEYTSWQGCAQKGWGRTGQYRELVQIGAIKLHKGQPWQEAETFDVLIKPVINPVLSSYLTNLIGITQSQLDAEGLATAEALQQFADFCGDSLVYSNGQDLASSPKPAASKKLSCR